jgi:hypothetical protein
MPKSTDRGWMLRTGPLTAAARTAVVPESETVAAADREAKVVRARSRTTRPAARVPIPEGALSLT